MLLIHDCLLMYQFVTLVSYFSSLFQALILTLLYLSEQEIIHAVNIDLPVRRHVIFALVKIMTIKAVSLEEINCQPRYLSCLGLFVIINCSLHVSLLYRLKSIVKSVYSKDHRPSVAAYI